MLFISKHYTYRTEEIYMQWIRRYILFHNKRYPRDMGRAEIEAFLTHLPVEGQVSASTQNQAPYQEVVNLAMSGIDAVQSKRPQYVPTVLTKQEAIDYTPMEHNQFSVNSLLGCPFTPMLNETPQVI